MLCVKSLGNADKAVNLPRLQGGQRLVVVHHPYVYVSALFKLLDNVHADAFALPRDERDIQQLVSRPLSRERCRPTHDEQERKQEREGHREPVLEEYPRVLARNEQSLPEHYRHAIASPRTS